MMFDGRAAAVAIEKRQDVLQLNCTSKLMMESVPDASTVCSSEAQECSREIGEPHKVAEGI